MKRRGKIGEVDHERSKIIPGESVDFGRRTRKRFAIIC